MKRVKLIRHLKQHGCQFLREGSDHTIFVNPTNRHQSPVPGTASFATNWPD